MSDFFIKHPLDVNRRTCKRVEELISKYSLQLYVQNTKDVFNTERENDYLLLRSDFNELLNNIRGLNISGNYIGLMSWLIDRAFMVSPDIKRNQKEIRSKLRMNKSILIKALYQTNSANLLKCFSKNC